MTETRCTRIRRLVSCYKKRNMQYSHLDFPSPEFTVEEVPYHSSTVGRVCWLTTTDKGGCGNCVHLHLCLAVGRRPDFSWEDLRQLCLSTAVSGRRKTTDFSLKVRW
jgi:hypothetical protein